MFPEKQTPWQEAEQWCSIHQSDQEQLCHFHQKRSSDYIVNMKDAAYQRRIVLQHPTTKLGFVETCAAVENPRSQPGVQRRWAASKAAFVVSVRGWGQLPECCDRGIWGQVGWTRRAT